MARKKKESTSQPAADGGAEAPESKTEASGSKGGKGGKVVPMLVSGALVLAGGAAQRFLFASPTEAATGVAAPGEATGAAAAGAAAAKEKAKAEEGEIVKVQDMTINLADPEPRYLRVGVAVVLGKGVVAKEFEVQGPRISDIVIAYYGAKKVDELRGEESMAHAKEELVKILSEEVPEAKIHRLLFTSFLVQ